MTISDIVSFFNTKDFGKREESYSLSCLLYLPYMFALWWFVCVIYSGRGMQIQGQT